MSQNIHLILFDILGYSSWMKNPDEPLNARIDMLKKVIASLDALKKKMNSDIELHRYMYADNIILWTPDYSKNGANCIFFYGSFLLSLFLHVGLPVRSAVASGEAYMSFENMMFQGPPLVEAHEGEESQDWLGGIVTKSTEGAIGKSNLESSRYLVKYKIPIKGDGNKPLFVLDWPNIVDNTPDWCRKHLCVIDDLQYLKERSPETLEQRHDATIKFYNSAVNKWVKS